MLTNADLESLLSQPESFPFLSVYLDLGPQARASRSYETVVRKRFSELEELFEKGSKEEALFWQAVKRVWDFINNELPQTGHGAALFVAPGLDFWRSYTVAYRFETEVVLDRLPYVRPLAHVVEEHEHHLVVETRSDTASVFVVHLRAPTPVSRVAELETEVPGKTAQGGWSQRRFQWHRRDHIMRHIKRVAEALEGLYDQYNCSGIILLGQDQTIAELRKHLSRRLRDKVIAVGPERPTDSQEALLERVLPLLKFEERLEEMNTLQRIVTELERGGLASAGLEEVIAAGMQQRIDILVIGSDVEADGYECPSCGALMTATQTEGQCIYCGADAVKVKLSNALLRLAQTQGAEVEIVPPNPLLERLGGVAALLRY